MKDCYFWKCFWEECKWEFEKVRLQENPGCILKCLRYMFAFCYLLSPPKWISGTLKKQAQIERGNLRPYCCIDIYVTVCFVFEVASIGILHWSLIPREPISGIIIGLLSYRLFVIFQSWVNQFVLKSEWEAINVNRSLVLVFVSYFEIIIIGAVVRFICQQPGEFNDAFYNSLMTMIANPQTEVGSAILYTQIMFVILFVTVVVQHVVGRLSSR